MNSFVRSGGDLQTVTVRSLDADSAAAYMKPVWYGRVTYCPANSFKGIVEFEKIAYVLET